MQTRSRGGNETRRKYYPVFLSLAGRKAVVVGGGRVAERKVLSLLDADADVTVVSPALTPRLLKEKTGGRIAHIARAYRTGDARGAFLVVAATESADVNTKVAGDATSLVNVVDVPSLCSFIAPSIVKRGPLQLAISTGGVSPALAKSIRRELEKIYGPEFPPYLRFLRRLRTEALKKIGPGKKRERFLKSVASEDVLRMLRRQGLASVTKKVTEEFKKVAAESRQLY
jgi:precorrin-2 dehydrogenase/sirohydrochlorin ferrochelatase